jgi:lysophospholipase L1-like esterase
MKKKILILLLFCVTMILNATHAAAEVFVDPSDVKILYTGRWNFSNPSIPSVSWQGSSIIAKFKGSAISAIFGTGSTTEYFRIIIDDDQAGSTKIPVYNTIQKYILAAGLTDTEHKIEIVKETYNGFNWTFHGFEVTGTGLVAPPDRPERQIEFYGDSNLAGYSLEHEQNQGDTHLRGSFYGYAGITSRMLNAEYHNISRSGATISSLHRKYDRLDWWKRKPIWNFADFSADVVVVNLGANDVGSPKNKIKADYHALLDDLRTSHPGAHIVLFNAWGWDYDEPANYTWEVINERHDNGDTNTSYAIFPWLFEQWHGCEYDHGGMAKVLADHLSDVMGWDQTPRDVMSGFGVNGDVANGSFEEVAPFGGFGWRYSTTDNNIYRVEDPAGAVDGVFYLRLENGKAVHQPNPAVDGQTFIVTAWMRGASDGDQAKISIDFRDQEMWTSPLQTFSEIKTLSTDWDQYTMAATAPIGGLKPVYHTRLTLQATQGEYVDFDGLVMSISGPTCGDGVCEGDETSENCAIDCACTSDSGCNDGESCTDDTCDTSTGQCINSWPSCGLEEGCCGPDCPNDPDCFTCLSKGTACNSDSECCGNKCRGGKCR